MGENTVPDLNIGVARDRQESADMLSLDADSLVGSYFHADAERGWQGCVVAEPKPGIYLCERFEWVGGSSSSQVLVSIEDMMGWHFYDTPDWMRDHYENVIRSERRCTKPPAEVKTITYRNGR